MGTWFLNRALTNLRAEVDTVWPNRDRTSDGTIGDAAHQGTSSDHNPDSDGSVDAWDMDINGVDVWHIIEQFEKHEASRYWIYNRQIATRSNGWGRETYTGTNPHDKHVHFNTRSEYENSSKPWNIGQEMVSVDMTKDELRALIREVVWLEKAKEYYDHDGDGVRDDLTRLDTLHKAHELSGLGRDAAVAAQELAGRAVDATAETRGALNTFVEEFRDFRDVAFPEAVESILTRLPDPQTT